MTKFVEYFELKLMDDILTDDERALMREWHSMGPVDNITRFEAELWEVMIEVGA